MIRVSQRCADDKSGASVDVSADPDRLKYDNGTFNACSNNGDYVSLDWTGGDVTIVGATKPK